MIGQERQLRNWRKRWRCRRGEVDNAGGVGEYDEGVGEDNEGVGEDGGAGEENG